VKETGMVVDGMSRGNISSARNGIDSAVTMVTTSISALSTLQLCIDPTSFNIGYKCQLFNLYCQLLKRVASLGKSNVFSHVFKERWTTVQKLCKTKAYIPTNALLCTIIYQSKVLILKYLKTFQHVSIFIQIIFRELVGSLLKSLNLKNFKNVKGQL